MGSRQKGQKYMHIKQIHVWRYLCLNRLHYLTCRFRTYSFPDSDIINGLPLSIGWSPNSFAWPLDFLPSGSNLPFQSSYFSLMEFFSSSQLPFQALLCYALTCTVSPLRAWTVLIVSSNPLQCLAWCLAYSRHPRYIYGLIIGPPFFPVSPLPLTQYPLY